MKKIIRKTAFLVSCLSVSAVFFTGCNKEDDAPATAKPVEQNQSVFVLNEGNYGDGNASFSLYNKAKKTVEAGFFETINKRPLGDVLQSGFILNNTGYLVVNNSHKVEVIDMSTLKASGVIANLLQPRYFTASGQNVGYVTEWISYGANGRVSVIDLQTNSVIKTITVGKQPEKMLLHNNKLYVANSGETFISVIDAKTNALLPTIPVKEGPKEFALDKLGNIWVLCGGFYQPDFSTSPGHFVKFDPAEPIAQTILPFSGTISQPEDLITNSAKDKLYYSYEGAVYEMPVSATSIPATPLISRYFYGLGIDPENNTIYGGLAPSFKAGGSVIRYNTSGIAIDSFQAGVAPNGFLFW